MNGLSDLDAIRPRKARKPVAKAGKPGKGKSMGTRLRRLRSRVTLVVASAGFSAIMVGIVCNAVLFQKGHHPAPLFGTAAPAEAPVPPPRPTALVEPVPVAPPAAEAVAEPTAAPGPASVAVPAHHAPVHAPAHRATAKADGIGHLLGQDQADATPVHRAAKVRPGQPHDAAARTPAKPAQTTVARTNAPLDLIAKKIRALTTLAAKDRPAAAN